MERRSNYTWILIWPLKNDPRPNVNCISFQTRAALRHIRHFLAPDVANTLSCSIVGARIDYCNSILYGASTSSITKLQRLQNSLARFVLQQLRRTHAEPLLQSLHWLPVEHRVIYKLAILTFNVRLTATPDYLNSLISNRVTGTRMSLRSSTRSLMAVPRTKTVCASSSFSVCAPVVWNRTFNWRHLSSLLTVHRLQSASESSDYMAL